MTNIIIIVIIDIMKTVIQRVKKASVKIDGKIKTEIAIGLLCLIGFKKDDSINDIEYTVQKIINLRIFEDENKKMNLSAFTVSGEILFVPNFTLYGNCKRGLRPDFITAADIETGRQLFEQLKKHCETLKNIKIKFGVFQASMEIELINDGPVTIILESRD